MERILFSTLPVYITVDARVSLGAKCAIDGICLFSDNIGFRCLQDLANNSGLRIQSVCVCVYSFTLTFP